MSDEDHSAFPVHASIFGVAIVTIPATDYADLLRMKSRLAALEKAEQYALPPRSPIEADTAVKAFLIERLGKMSVKTILAECLRTFGEDRTPSRSSAYAFWSRLRKRSSGDIRRKPV